MMAERESAYLYRPFSDKVLAIPGGGFLSEESVYYK